MTLGGHKVDGCTERGTQLPKLCTGSSVRALYRVFGLQTLAWWIFILTGKKLTVKFSTYILGEYHPPRVHSRDECSQAFSVFHRSSAPVNYCERKRKVKTGNEAKSIWLVCVSLCFFKGEAKEKERLSVSPGAQKDEGEVAPKRPRLNRDFKPFDYAGSKFTEFTKGQSVEVSVLVVNMGTSILTIYHLHPPPIF